MAASGTRTATLYRMVMDKHVCPFGLKAKDLLRRQGFQVDDRWLTTREATDAFKQTHGVKTTPQAFIGDERIGAMTICVDISVKPLLIRKRAAISPSWRCLLSPP